MPCGINHSETYILKVFFCDNKGDFICIEFNIQFPECHGCPDKNENDPRGRSPEDGHASDKVSIYPNPASQNLNISCIYIGTYKIDISLSVC